MPFPLSFQSGQLIGVLFNIVGLRIAALSIRTFRRHRTTIKPTEATNELVSDGPYKFSRNPMYLSLTITYVGAALIIDSPWSLICLIPVLAIIKNHVIAREEKYLEQRFGEEYHDYKARVTRWI